MKKSILFYGLAVTSMGLMAFNVSDSYNTVHDSNETPVCDIISHDDQIINEIMDKVYSDFFYDIGSRFSPIKKSELDETRSMVDFIAKDYEGNIVEYRSVSVIVVIDDLQTDIRASGDNEVLTNAQLKLLQSMDYSTNFVVKADFVEKDKTTGELQNYLATPYHTVVPEKQAVYEPGTDVLLEYLRINNKENTANLDESKLQPAKLYFTVTKEGEISNIRLDRTSGFSEIDQTMIKLLTEAPGNWTPAQSSTGKNVDQELVVSFGMVGC